MAGSVSFDTQPPTADLIERRMRDAAGRYPWLVVEDAGHVAGFAFAHPFDPRGAYAWAVETTIYLAPHAAGRGLGRALYAALIDALVRQGFVHAVARIALPNPPSVALHAALGFEQVGLLPAIGWKDGRWIDVGLWRRALADPGDPPRMPGAA